MKLQLVTDHPDMPGNETIMRDTETGLILPWLTRPCLAWLDRQKFSTVFEWGVGYGAEWWRSRARYSGVDHDEAWAKRCGVYHHTEMVPYCRAVLQHAPQIAVIDGSYRTECAVAILGLHTLPDHVIIDNANWDEEQLAFKVLSKAFSNVQAFWDVDHPDWLTAVLSRVPVL